MLRFMRKYATGYLIKILFGLIIVVFIFWGVGSFRDADRVVAEVGPYKVSATEYRESYNRLVNFYRMLFREKFDEGAVKELKLRERAMDDLVDQYLLLLQAKQLGLSVSDREFAERLARMGEFQTNGQFDEKKYLELLKRNGLDPKQFEESERRSMLTRKVASVLGDIAASPSDAEAWGRYVKVRGRVNLGYVEFDPSDYKTKVNVTDKEISDIYEKEKDTYKSEPTYHLKEVVIEQKSGLKDDQVYLELLKSKDVEGYARQNGLQVVDLGTLKETAISKRLKDLKAEAMLKDLKKGEISLPVRDQGRSYIFLLVDKEEGKPLEKTAVLKEIEEKLKTQKAKQMAKATAEEAIAKNTVPAKKETGLVPRNITVFPNLGTLPKEHPDILSVSEKSPIYGKPVDMNGKYYVFIFKSEKMPDQAEWDKEKVAFKQSIAAQNREEMVKTLLEDLKKKEKVKIRWEEV
jgi:parvulin-like peptidyl-prolyl isomerase